MNRREITEREDEDYFNDDDDEEEINYNLDDNIVNFGFDKKGLDNKDKDNFNKIFNNNYKKPFGEIEPEFDHVITQINSQHSNFLNRKKQSDSDVSDLESSIHIDELDLESENSEMFNKKILRKFK